MKRLERKKKVNPLLKYLFMKNHKGMGEVKVELPMVLEEDPNPKKISNIITATKFAT